MKSYRLQNVCHRENFLRKTTWLAMSNVVDFKQDVYRVRQGGYIMETPKIFESEYRFCLILWENEPVKSGKPVELCKERLGWKPIKYEKDYAKFSIR